MDELLNKVLTLVENGEEVNAREVYIEQLYWIIDNYSLDLKVPFNMLFSDILGYACKDEFPVEAFEDLSELERPTKSCEMFLDVSRRLTLYGYGYITDTEMKDWVQTVLSDGKEEQVYCMKG
jgi:hypothetical protein